jgi:hypothetical protein
MRPELPDKRYASTSTSGREKGKERKAADAVVGESEGNRMKIKMNLITCSVCMQSYNISTREPQVICLNNHTYCKECTAQFLRTNRKCPECRAQMREPIRNRDLYQLVEDN